MNRFVGFYSHGCPSGHEAIRNGLARRLAAANQEVTHVGYGAWGVALWPQSPHSIDDLTEFGGASGVVTGTLFASGPGGGTVLRQPLPASAADRMTADGGKAFTRAYWGRYVAFAGTADGRELTILRDPSGVLLALHCRVGDTTWFASDCDALMRFSPAEFRPDWSYIAGFVQYGPLISTRSGVAGVEEIPEGKSLCLTPDGATLRTAWRMAEFAGCRKPDDTGEELRSLLNGTVAHWLAAAGRPLLNFSGGLDSTMVLDHLIEREAEPVCLTLHWSPSAKDNDLRRARMAAAHFSAPLVEMDLASVEFAQLSEAYGALPMMHRPNADAGVVQVSRWRDAVADEHGCRTHWFGSGGDNVFLVDAVGECLTDSLRHRGGRGAWHVASTVAEVMQQPVWFVAARGIMAAFTRRYSRDFMLPLGRDIPAGIFTRKAGDLCRPEDIVTHRQAEGVRDPGKVSHIALMQSSAFLHNETFSPLVAGWKRDLICPLMSQPLLEWAAGIASYWFFEGGVSRAPQRRALSATAPHQVWSQMWKSDPKNFFFEKLACHSDRIVQYLRNGRLAQEGIIDADAVANMVKRSKAQLKAELPRLYLPLTAERWLNAWDCRAAAGHHSFL